MPVQNGHLPFSPSITNDAVNTLPIGNQTPNIPSKDRLHTVHNGAKDITQTTRTAVKNQNFKMLSIISWVKCIVCKCGLPGYPLVLLISPFLVPASIIYDGFRGITLLCRKIAKIETPVEKLLPKTEKHQHDVEELLNDKATSDIELQVQAKQLKARQGKANQQTHLLQWKNSQLEQQVNQLKTDWDYRKNCWQQDITASRQRAENAEQQVVELTRKLDMCSKKMNKTDQGYQTEKTRLSSELKQLTNKLAEKDKLVKDLKYRILTDENIRREETNHLKTISQERTSNTNTLQKELEYRTKEIGKLQKEQDKIIINYNAQQSLWETQAKEYLNTINAHRVELDKQLRINKDAMDQLRHMELELKLNKQRYQSELGTLTETITRNKEKMKSLKLENIELTGEYQETERKLKEQLAFQQEQLSNTRSQNECLSTEMKEKEQQIQTLSREIKSTQKNHQDKEAQCQDAREQLQITISELKKALQASQSSVSSLQEAQRKEQVTYNQIQESLKLHQTTINSYQKQVEKLEMEIETDKRKMQNLQSQLNHSERNHKVELEKLNAKLTEKEQQTHKLKQKIESLQTDFNELSTAKQETERQGCLTEHQLRQLLTDKEKHQSAEFERLKSELSKKERQIQKLQQEIDEIEQRLNKSEVKHQQLEIVKSQLAQAFQNSETTLSALQEANAKLALLEVELSNARTESDRISAEMKEKEHQIQTLSQEITMAQKKYQKREEANHEDRKHLYNTICEHEEMLQKRQHQISVLQERLKENIVNYEQLQEQAIKSKSDFVELRQDYQRSVVEMISTITSLKEDIEQYEKQHQEYQLEIDQLNNKLKELKGAVDALRTENYQLVTAGKDAQAQSHRMESQFWDQYKEKITDLEGELYYQKTMVASLEQLLTKQSIERCNYIFYLEKILSEHQTKLHLASMYPEDYPENKPEDNRPRVLRRTLSL